MKGWRFLFTAVHVTVASAGCASPRKGGQAELAWVANCFTEIDRPFSTILLGL